MIADRRLFERVWAEAAAGLPGLYRVLEVIEPERPDLAAHLAEVVYGSAKADIVVGFGEGASGKLLSSLVVAFCERGVRVRLLADLYEGDDRAAANRAIGLRVGDVVAEAQRGLRGLHRFQARRGHPCRGRRACGPRHPFSVPCTRYQAWGSRSRCLPADARGQIWAWERRPLFAAETRKGPVALATGDLEGNGHKDLVALTATGETLVFLGNGKGSFTREKMSPPAFPGACRGAHVELADLDGDGRDEMVASFSDEPDQYGHCPSDGGMTAWKASPRTGARQP